MTYISHEDSRILQDHTAQGLHQAEKGPSRDHPVCWKDALAFFEPWEDAAQELLWRRDQVPAEEVGLAYLKPRQRLDGIPWGGMQEVGEPHRPRRVPPPLYLDLQPVHPRILHVCCTVEPALVGDLATWDPQDPVGCFDLIVLGGVAHIPKERGAIPLGVLGHVRPWLTADVEAMEEVKADSADGAEPGVAVPGRTWDVQSRSE